MEKLNEVKETYAKELGYEDWETCINDQPNHNVETLMDEVALRLYGVSNRRELLIAFCDWYNKEIPDYLEKSDKTIDRYLESNL